MRYKNKYKGEQDGKSERVGEGKDMRYKKKYIGEQDGGGKDRIRDKDREGETRVTVRNV